VRGTPKKGGRNIREEEVFKGLGKGFFWGCRADEWWKGGAW
jgi:hypothetical protein